MIELVYLEKEQYQNVLPQKNVPAVLPPGSPSYMSREMSRAAPSLVKSSCKSAPEVVGTRCALATPWVDENSGNKRSTPDQTHYKLTNVRPLRDRNKGAKYRPHLPKSKYRPYLSKFKYRPHLPNTKRLPHLSKFKYRPYILKFKCRPYLPKGPDSSLD